MPSASEIRPGTRRFARQRMTRRGAVLLVSISVLVVLALLATVFASMAEIERSISRNYVDDIRARMLAESGIQEAVSRLQESMDRGEDLNNNNVLDPGEDKNGNGRLDKSWPDVTTWWYHGEDRNANSVLDAGEDRDADGKLDTLDCKLEDALRPSFAMIDPGGPAGQARRIFIQEPTGSRPTSVCGALSVSSYGRNADQYLLKIVDTSSQIYLNDLNPNLERILNSLSVNLGGPPNLGTQIVTGRPPVGYKSKYDLLTRRVISQTEFDRIRDYVTSFAWVDPNVVNPVPLSATEHAQPYYLVKGAFGQYWRPTSTGTYQPGAKIYRYGPAWAVPANVESTLTKGGRNELRLTTATNIPSISREAAVYGVDELNPQWIETTSRAPLNINTTSKEVLMALIEGLDGFYLMERPRAAHTNGVAGTAWTRMQEMPGTGYRLIPTGGAAVPATLGSTTTYGSELGFLYRTGPILGPAGTSSAGTRGRLAEILARKIIDYRSGRPTLLGGGTGGTRNIPKRPFTSWAQFNEFLDQLLLQDLEVQANIMEGSAVNWPVGSVERAVHAQARMDVLKANFNPNLHLNEANPEESLWTWVDKTDLVVASSEFCFTPMGIFEIESLGRVYRPIPGTADALTAGTNVELLAEKKIVTNVQLYDAVRETSQKQFYGDNPGVSPGFTRRGSTEDSKYAPQINFISTTPMNATNNGWAVQSFPEPENGDAPYDAAYEGYVALSTYGGFPSAARTKHTVFTNLPAPKAVAAGVPPGPLIRTTTARYRNLVASTATGASGFTPAGSGGIQSPLYESARAHFDTDFNLHYLNTQGTQYSIGGNLWYGERRVHFARRFERSQGAANLAMWFNYPAPSETTNKNPSFANRDIYRVNNLRGPYSMSDLIDGRAQPNYDRITPIQREFRVCRSFRAPKTVSAAGSTTYTPRTTDSFFANLPFHYYAPSSLRGDGGYIERNNVPAWSPTRAKGITGARYTVNGPVNVYQGTVAYWIKPNFFPDLAGKIRSYFSIAGNRTRLDNPNGGTQIGLVNPNAFTHFFVPNNASGVPGGTGASFEYLGGSNPGGAARRAPFSSDTDFIRAPGMSRGPERPTVSPFSARPPSTAPSRSCPGSRRSA